MKHMKHGDETMKLFTLTHADLDAIDTRAFGRQELADELLATPTVFVDEVRARRAAEVEYTELHRCSYGPDVTVPPIEWVVVGDTPPGSHLHAIETTFNDGERALWKWRVTTVEVVK